MKKHKTIILFTFVILSGLFANCKKERDCHRQPDSDYLIFGSFYGMCYGETCVEIFKIENETLYEDTTDQYPFGTNPYNGSYLPLPPSQYEMVKDIVNYIPNRQLEETETIIGMPDAYDQGGYYVELKENGDRRFWIVDTDKDNIPNYLHSFVDTLNSYINKLQ